VLAGERDALKPRRKKKRKTIDVISGRRKPAQSARQRKGGGRGPGKKGEHRSFEASADCRKTNSPLMGSRRGGREERREPPLNHTFDVRVYSGKGGKRKRQIAPRVKREKGRGLLRRCL